jgi:cytidine deaminase
MFTTKNQMKEVTVSIHYSEVMELTDLPLLQQQLLTEAKKALEDAYAPYSNFRVGAAALLENGKVIRGSNQENASSPVGICAERVTLSAASAAYPGLPIVAIAISAKANDRVLNQPVSPCGLCRQTLLEYEERFQRAIEIVLQGETGKIISIPSARELLPLSFGKGNLKG